MQPSWNKLRIEPLARLAKASLRVLVCCFAGASYALAANQLLSVGVTVAQATEVRVEIRLNNMVEFRVGTLREPDRIYIDLPNCDWTKQLQIPKSVPENESLLGVRVGRTQGTSRVVLDLKRSTRYEIRRQGTNLEIVLLSGGLSPQTNRPETGLPSVGALSSLSSPAEASPAPPKAEAVAEQPAIVVVPSEPPVGRQVQTPAANPPSPSPENATAAFQAPATPAPAAIPAVVPQAVPPGGGRLSGTVVDPSGALVAGAAVKATNRATKQQFESATDGNGSFQLQGLPAGSYEVEVDAAGFEIANSRANVSLARPLEIRIGLQVSKVIVDLTVDGTQSAVSTDISENRNTIIVDQRLIDRLPAIGGDVLSAVSRIRGLSGATVIVDGVETPMARLSAAEIQSIKINQNPYSAEFNKHGSGRIEVTTKSSAKAFHGNLGLSFQDSIFNARDAFAASRPKRQTRSLDAGFSGPLGQTTKGRSFAANLYRNDTNSESVIYAVTPSGQFRENAPVRQGAWYANAKFQQTLGDKGFYTLRYQVAGQSGRGTGVGGFSLPERGVDSNSRQHQLNLTHTKLIGASGTNEFALRLDRNTSTTVSRLPGQQTIVVLDAFTGGGAQADSSENSGALLIQDTVAFVRGKHQVRLGASLPELNRNGSSDLSNFWGTYYFSSLATYNSGTPFNYTQRRGDPSLIFWRSTAAAFIQDNITLRPNLSVGLGLRYEWQQRVNDRNNFAPRVSFAYSPGTSRRFVLRGGSAVFYDRVSWTAISDTFRNNGTRIQEIILPNPAFPNALGGGQTGTVQPSSIYQLSRNLRTPYMFDFSLGLEANLTENTAFYMEYRGVRRVKQLRSEDLNAPQGPLFNQRPNPAIGVLRNIESSARGQFDSLETGVSGELTKYFSGQVFYTLSRNFANTEGIGYFPARQFNQSGEWAPTGSDQRHAVWALGSISAGSWAQFGFVVNIGTGMPYNLTTGRDDNGDSRATDRPNGVSRNSLRLPWTASLDARWNKSFVLNKKLKEKGPMLNMSVDAFNVTNRLNVSSVVGTLSSPLFGVPIGSQSGRRLQVGAGLKF